MEPHWSPHCHRRTRPVNLVLRFLSSFLFFVFYSSTSPLVSFIYFYSSCVLLAYAVSLVLRFLPFSHFFFFILLRFLLTSCLCTLFFSLLLLFFSVENRPCASGMLTDAFATESFAPLTVVSRNWYPDRKTLTVAQLVGYLRSWSSYQT